MVLLMEDEELQKPNRRLKEKAKVNNVNPNATHTKKTRKKKKKIIAYYYSFYKKQRFII